jgi:hypothetical protein
LDMDPGSHRTREPSTSLVGSFRVGSMGYSPRLTPGAGWVGGTALVGG